MTILMLVCGTLAAMSAILSIAFELYMVFAKRETPIFPLFVAALMFIVSWGSFSYYAEDRAQARATRFEDKKIVCENFVRYGRRKKRFRHGE